jgi:uncharacterized membrane protein HdeD (DUF308 family)
MNDLSSGSPELQKLAKRVSGFSLVLAILLIVFGGLAILLPIEFSFGVVIVVAWLLMIGGVVHFIHAFRRHEGHRFWNAAVGIIYFLTGLYLRMNPLLGLAALTLALIAFFVAQGLVDIFLYFRTRGSGASGWLLFHGVVTLILGLLIWQHWPSGALWVVGTLVGINMIMTGTTRLMLTLAVRRAVKGAAAA